MPIGASGNLFSNQLVTLDTGQIRVANQFGSADIRHPMADKRHLGVALRRLFARPVYRPGYDV